MAVAPPRGAVLESRRSCLDRALERSILHLAVELVAQYAANSAVDRVSDGVAVDSNVPEHGADRPDPASRPARFRHSHLVYARDGKSRTITTTGTNPQGQKVNNVVAWDKQ